MGEKWWYLLGGVAVGYFAACAMDDRAGLGFRFSFGARTNGHGIGGRVPMDQPTSTGYQPADGVYNPVGAAYYPSPELANGQTPNLVGGGAIS